jgi:Asp-tRNA(Asn)/Glu-tRNA(Gln) amidotransferase A subunit family amidase
MAIVESLTGANGHHSHSSNLTGQPSVSIPVGLTRSGLPVGVQVSGRHFADDMLLDVAKAFEQVHPWEHSFQHGGPE